MPNLNHALFNGVNIFEFIIPNIRKINEKIKDQKRVAVIGHITSDKESYQFVSKSEQVQELTAAGWNAILKKD